MVGVGLLEVVLFNKHSPTCLLLIVKILTDISEGVSMNIIMVVNLGNVCIKEMNLPGKDRRLVGTTSTSWLSQVTEDGDHGDYFGHIVGLFVSSWSPTC